MKEEIVDNTSEYPDAAVRQRNPKIKRLIREERKVLEKHAKEAGCKLIIDPFLSYKKYGPNAKNARLNGILDFLKKMPDSKVTIAIEKNISEGQNLTIVGDWFMAESISAMLSVGYVRRYLPVMHAASAAGLNILIRSLIVYLKNKILRQNLHEISP